MGFDGWGWLEKQSKDKEARALIRTMLAVEPTTDTWRGMTAAPAGSPLAIILNSFQRNTDVALEIPFFVFLHFLSGIMLKEGTTITGPIGTKQLDLWTVVLAGSGGGKTLTHEIIERCSPVKSEFPEPGTSLKFLADLYTHSPVLWFQDEIAQKLKLIEKPSSPLSECKDYLLRAYDNKPITRSTMAETITVEKPVIGILGLNTQASFLKALSAESLLDGFAQRFGFVWAEKDPKRPMVENSWYPVDLLTKDCTKAFEIISKTKIHKQYTLPPVAMAAYDQAFRSQYREGMDESFYRRAMFRAFKYAVLYHVILGKDSEEIDAEDIGWGARLCQMHIKDMANILGKDAKCGASIELARKAQALKKKLTDAGKPFNARAIQQGMRDVKSAESAKLVMDLVGEEE